MEENLMDMKIDNTIVLEPDPARVVEGLRDTGYDFNTAMADLVDNSIAAGATIIQVNISYEPNKKIHVYIADNGIGMDMDGLKNAMRYGSDRRKDANSLGKFGLGLKTASTAFCRSLSVLSKNATSDYHKVQWDLDVIAETKKWSLLTPETDQDEIDLLETVTRGGSGTLVIWDKVDRFMKAYDNDGSFKKAFNSRIEKLKTHFAMVYQRFLDKSFNLKNQIVLKVNDDQIFPWDPFCRNQPKTQILAELKQKVVLPNGNNTSFTLKAYLLPRETDFSSPEEKSAARINNDNEGFYVYRENRLIYSGGWLGMFTSDPHLALLRVDFSFDASLDEAFNVDIKKSHVMLNEELFLFIKEKFLPAPKREANNVYRKGQTKDIQKGSENAHDASNTNISQKAAMVENSKVEVLNKDAGQVKISNPKGNFTGTFKIVENGEKPGKIRVVPVESIESDMLWEPTIVNNCNAVSINQSHEFYKKVYAPILHDQNLVIGMDALLWALSEAELATYTDEIKDQYEDMRVQVSRFLKKLVKDLPEPDIDNNSND